MREEADNWWKQARHDADTAEYLLDGKRLEAASFYVQQAVEKALKSLFMERNREPAPTTHSLVRLGRDCGAPARFRTFLRHLGPEYFLSRYPDASGDVPHEAYDEDDVRSDLNTAKELIAWVETELQREPPTSESSPT